MVCSADYHACALKGLDITKHTAAAASRPCMHWSVYVAAAIFFKHARVFHPLLAGSCHAMSVGALTPFQNGLLKSVNVDLLAACRVFRKGGTMTALGEYIAESKTTPAPVRRKNATKPDRLGPQIAASNVGYQLLQKAGWQEGQGVGANQQGRAIPLAAYHQQARHGIGAGESSEASRAGRKRPSQQPQALDANSPAKKRKADAQPVPDVPEDPTVKRQRHQQVSYCWHNLLHLLTSQVAATKDFSKVHRW